MANVLCIAPHPDDETIGCGGTIAKHKAGGDTIYWLLVTNVSGEDGWPADIVSGRQQEIETVRRIYGFDGLFKLDFPTTKLDVLPRVTLIDSMARIIQEVCPDTVYLPNRSDVHSDHQIVFQAAMSCIKSFRCPFIRRLLMYETLSETEYAPALQEAAFVPNVFVDISATFQEKEKAMRVYASELMDDTGPRSLCILEKQNAVRGSRIGVRYAEAFMLLLESA